MSAFKAEVSRDPNLSPDQGPVPVRAVEVIGINLRPNTGRYGVKAAWIVDQFDGRLAAEYHIFNDTFSDLADDCSGAREIDWLIAENAVFRQCGPYYGRYQYHLGEILAGLKDMAVFLGLDMDAPCTTEAGPRESESCHSNGAIRNILASSARCKAFLLALGTVTGAMGGTLQLHLSKLSDANQQLKKVRRESQMDPSTGFFQQLDVIRGHVNVAARVLGSDNGFSCQCKEPHTAYLRIKEVLGHNDEKTAPQFGDVCSLVMYNHSTTDPLWDCVDLHAEILDDGDGGTIALNPSTKAPAPSTGSAPSHKAKSEKLVSAFKRQETKKDVIEKPKKARFMGILRGHGDSDTNRDPKRAESEDAETPLASDPSTGLCAYIQASRNPQSISQGERTKSPIILSRGKLKVQLKATNEADETVLWTATGAVQNHLTDIGLSTLSTEQKLQLAYRVAFGLFYLHSTPWLGDTWSSDHIFLRSRSQGDMSVEPLFSKLTEPNHVSTEGGAANDRGTLILPLITHFGRFLLELSFGAPWNHIKDAFLSGVEPSLLADKDIAVFNHILSWVDDPKVASWDKPFHLEGNSFFDAIRSCFFGDFSQGSINDTALRLEVYRHIIRPLQFALEDFQALQMRTFGPPVKLLEENLISPAPSRKNPFRLFDDEDVSGDVVKKAKDADRWFEDYAKVIDIAGRVSPRRPEPHNRVRVAVLDTGVDVTHDLLKGPFRRRQLVYQDFVGPSTDIPRDNHGHGTHVTSILLKMAENVDIYVARISSDGRTFKSDQVQKAIEWAVDEKQVHIISMSFGFPNVDQSLEPIRRAILKAHARDVLVFAATGNKGKGYPISFPACMDEVISVGSTDGNNKTSDFVPTLGPGKRLCAVGEAISAAWICDAKGRKSHATMVRKAGTSYATPVAAGVAAMVMDFVWAERSMPGITGRYEHQTLRSKRGMLAVLARMLERDSRDTVEYLTPWKLFEEDLAQPITGTRCGILDTIISTLRSVYTPT